MTPLSLLPPLWSLIIVSVLFGIALVPIYGRLSNQQKLKQVKRSIAAALFESVIFRRQARTTLRAQGRLFAGGLRYFLLAVPPILILAVPCILLLSWMNLYYGSTGVKPGEPVIATAVASDSTVLPKLSLLAGAGIDVTPPVRISRSREVVWRLNPSEPGVERIQLTADSVSAEKQFVSGPNRGRIHSFVSGSFLMKLLYPGDFDLPPGVESFWIDYPAAEYSVFGVRLDWVILFFIVSVASGLVASKFFGVEV